MDENIESKQIKKYVLIKLFQFLIPIHISRHDIDFCVDQRSLVLILQFNCGSSLLPLLVKIHRVTTSRISGVVEKPWSQKNYEILRYGM